MWALFWALLSNSCLILGLLFHLPLPCWVLSFSLVFCLVWLCSGFLWTVFPDRNGWCWVLWHRGHGYCAKKGASLYNSELLWGQFEANVGLSTELTWKGAVQGAQHSWLKSALQGQGRCGQVCDCQAGNFILASGKGTQSNTKSSNNWFQHKCLDSNTAKKGLWSLTIADFIAQMHLNMGTIACTTKGDQCTERSLHWETTPGYLGESCASHHSFSGDTVRHLQACTPGQGRAV